MSNQEMQVFQQDTNLTVANAFKDLLAGGVADELGAGISGNYAIVSIRGKTWRIKHQGNETPITDEKGDAVGSLEVVIIRANPFITKQFFEGGYTEGENSAPVCWSLDGQHPAAGVPAKQAELCAVCPQNKFGSRVTDAGVDVKACQDNKKLAVVPLEDIDNEAFGGPMLVRIPASSLKGLSAFGQKMKSLGYSYNSVAVRIGFDLEASHPKPVFRAIRPLTETEAEKIVGLYASAAVENVLGGEVAAPHGVKAAVEPPATDADFEVPAAQVAGAVKPAAPGLPAQAPAAAPATPAKKPAAAKKAPPAAAPAQPAPAAAPAGGGTFGKKKPAAAQAAPAAVAEPATSDAEQPQTASSLDNDIASILSELNGGTAG